MIAYDYPLLGVFWTILIVAGLALLLFFIIWCFIDNFRRKDHGGFAKVVWTILILFVPLFGALLYIIFRPSEVSA